ncbi:hypothetical protein AGMMS50239_33490 [Bacteroidia bacterium]|nr:hypothetical protein AGMMS50239_33490 [Bacteroidia bacterium]GHV30991.1 hypothetical protein FACS1894177_04590 [Bacteroidia bacterium]
MKIFNIIPFLFLMCSCIQNVTERNKTQILDEWYPLDAENLEGYHFMENNLCENKLGYYDRYFSKKKENDWSEQIVYADEKDDSYQIYFDEQTIINYQGNTTFYEIYRDSLRIYDLAKRKLVNWRIKFLSKDTMLLSSNNDSILNKFVRRNCQLDTIPLFDEIIFSLDGSSTTSLDDKYMLIKRNGEVVSLSSYGSNRYKMNENAFENIENRFKKANIKTIIANYKRENKQESEFIKSSITFVKGNKIVFSLENPIMNINTKEFLWAYLSALFCTSYNQLEFSKDYDMSSNYIPELFFWQTGFFTEDGILKLYNSERFYLLNLINKANKTDQDFTPIYTFRHLPIFTKFYNKTPKFKTDGRFYWYQENEYDKKKVTLDLGFNFIEVNNLADKFRER